MVGVRFLDAGVELLRPFAREEPAVCVRGAAAFRERRCDLNSVYSRKIPARIA